MKKQIDGWAFLGDDGEWKMFHPDFGKVQYQMLEGKLGAGKIVEVRLLDASDDSKDVVVPRELLEWVNNIKFLLEAHADQHDKNDSPFCAKQLRREVEKLNQILSKKEDELRRGLIRFFFGEVF